MANQEYIWTDHPVKNWPKSGNVDTIQNTLGSTVEISGSGTYSINKLTHRITIDGNIYLKVIRGAIKIITLRINTDPKSVLYEANQTIQLKSSIAEWITEINIGMTLDDLYIYETLPDLKLSNLGVNISENSIYGKNIQATKYEKENDISWKHYSVNYTVGPNKECFYGSSNRITSINYPGLEYNYELLSDETNFKNKIYWGYCSEFSFLGGNGLAKNSTNFQLKKEKNLLQLYNLDNNQIINECYIDSDSEILLFIVHPDSVNFTKHMKYVANQNIDNGLSLRGWSQGIGQFKYSEINLTTGIWDEDVQPNTWLENNNINLNITYDREIYNLTNLINHANVILSNHKFECHYFNGNQTNYWAFSKWAKDFDQYKCTQIYQQAIPSAWDEEQGITTKFLLKGNESLMTANHGTEHHIKVGIKEKYQNHLHFRSTNPSLQFNITTPNTKQPFSFSQFVLTRDVNFVNYTPIINSRIIKDPQGQINYGTTSELQWIQKFKNTSGYLPLFLSPILSKHWTYIQPNFLDNKHLYSAYTTGEGNAIDQSLAVDIHLEDRALETITSHENILDLINTYDYIRTNIAFYIVIHHHYIKWENPTITASFTVDRYHDQNCHTTIVIDNQTLQDPITSITAWNIARTKKIEYYYNEQYTWIWVDGRIHKNDEWIFNFKSGFTLKYNWYKEPYDDQKYNITLYKFMQFLL